MKIHGNSGSKNANSTLTEPQVRIIKIMLDMEWATGSELAEMFNTTEPNISFIRNEKAWKHVKGIY